MPRRVGYVNYHVSKMGAMFYSSCYSVHHYILDGKLRAYKSYTRVLRYPAMNHVFRFAPRTGRHLAGWLSSRGDRGRHLTPLILPQLSKTMQRPCETYLQYLLKPRLRLEE